MLGRWLKHWPGMYHNPALWTMTSDGFVPYKTFFIMWAATDSLVAADQYIAANAVSLGYAFARVGRDSPESGKVSARMRELARVAFPMVYDKATEEEV